MTFKARLREAPFAARSSPLPETTMNVLETGRLTLRRITTDDAPVILALVNDPAWLANIGDRGVRTLEDARAYIEKGPVAMYQRLGFGLYLAVRKEDGAAIGMAGLIKRDTLDDVDVGFAFFPEYRGQGYARESAAAVIAYGKRELGLERIVAITSPTNAPSIKVLEKVGLVFDRSLGKSPEGLDTWLFVPARA
jgi:ribosomal-protein-alanine N-acetyltransferase